MSQFGVELLAGVPSLFALGMLFRTAWSQRADWTATSGAILAAGWMFALPAATSVVFDKVRTGIDANGAPIRQYILPGYSQFAHLTNYALIVGALGLVCLQVRRRDTRPSTPAIAMLIAVLIAGLADTASGGGSFTAKPRLILLAVLLAAAVIRPLGATYGAALFGLSFASISGICAFLNFNTATYVCGQNKCGPLGILYFGLAQNENLLGLFLAAAIPFTYLAIHRSTYRWFFTTYLGSMVLYTGSRTSLIGAFFAILICALHNHDQHLGIRRGASWAIIAGGFVAGLVLPFTASNPTAFTGRAGEWMTARTLLSGHFFSGLGGDYWGSLGDLGVIPLSGAYSTHNQWLDALFDGGVLGLALLLAVLLAIGSAPAGPLLLTPVVFLGITERLISLAHADSFLWVLPALLLAAAESRAVSVLSLISSANGAYRDKVDTIRPKMAAKLSKEHAPCNTAIL